MANRFVLLLFLVMWLLCFTCPGMGQDAVVCRETYFVERHSEATISCEYDPSFYTVRWYFGGSEVSILLIDDGRRSGSGFDSGEYDITDEGAMIIKGADAKHEGTYKITVLDKSGKGTSKTMKVYVTVPITTLTIEDCGSSSSPLCTDINGVRTYLVCDVHNFWPSVTLHWLQVSENGSTPVPASTHTTSFDNTTSLFSSKSTLLYTPDLFSVQYFTCFASGNAAHQVSNKSIEVEGNIQVQEMTPTESHLEIGADLIIPCPINDLPFGKLQVKYPQTNYKVITIIASCTDDNTCGKNGRREVVIKNVRYKDEGLYQCISSDGNRAVQQETNMIITVSPETPNIIIKECKDAEKCPRHSDTTGSVSCAISGFRPPMYLSIETNNTEITLDHIDETITEDESTGTSTTLVLYAYEVPECSGSVVLTCISVPDQYSRPSIQADLSLNSESDNCNSGGGGSAVVIVLIVVIILVIAATVSGIFIYKRVFARRNKKKDDTGIPDPDQENQTLMQTEHDEISHSGEEAAKTERKTKNLKKEKKIDALFDQKMKNYVTGKEQYDNVRDLLDDFKSQNQPVDPYPLFKTFIEHGQIDDETILSLVKQVAASERDKWLSSSKVLELLNTVFARKQLPFRDRLKSADDMYLHKQIDIGEYSSEFLTNFQIHQRELEEVYNDLNKTKRIPQHNVIEILQKCLDNVLNMHRKDNDRDDRELFLKSIVRLDDDAQVMLHLLLLCVDNKSVDVNQYLLLLHDNGDKLSTETLIALLKGLKKIDVETDQFLLDELARLLSIKKLLPNEFVSKLKSCRDSSLISEDIVTEQLGVWISKPEILGDVHMEVMYQVIAQGLVTKEIVIEEVVSKGKREDTTRLLLHILARDKDLKTETKDIFHGVTTTLNLKPHELNAILRYVSDDERQKVCDHKEVSAKFLTDALGSKTTPWELQSIFELGLHHDLQVNILTEKKVVGDFEAIKVEEKAVPHIVQEFTKLNMDEKSCMTIWLKFVLFNLLGTKKTQQKSDKYLVLLGSVINNFKAKPSDIKTILDNMKISLDERITILTDRKMTKKILDSSKEDKWKVEDWVDLLLMLSNENQVSDNDRETICAHKEVFGKFLTDALGSKTTPWELQSIFELGIRHDIQVNVLTDKKVVGDFEAIKLEGKVAANIVQEFKKRNMDEKACMTIWLKFVLFNLLGTKKTQQKNDKYLVLLGSVINNFKAKPSDITTILDNMKISLDERITILTDRKMTKKILDSSKEDKWKVEDWVDLLLMLSNENQELDTQLENLTQDIMKKFEITKDDLRKLMPQYQDQLPKPVSEKLPETSSPAVVNPHVDADSSGENIKERSDGDTEDEKVENATSNSLVEETNNGQTDVPREKEEDRADN